MWRVGVCVSCEHMHCVKTKFHFGGSNGFLRSNAGLVLPRPSKGKPVKIVPPSEPLSEGKLRSSFRLRSLLIREAAIFDVVVLGKVSEMRGVNKDLARLVSF